MKGKELIALIEADEWYLSRQSGSHRQFKPPAKPVICTVSFHKPFDDIPIGTLNSALKQAGLK